jgi:hypothetical protein
VWFRSFWQPPFTLRSVILNLKSGDVLAGMLWSSRGSWLVLRNANLLKAGAAPTPIDGEAVVHRDNLAFVQVLP